MVGQRAIPLLSLAFFLSGSAALVLETLWFRQAGLALGNSVWASSLVLASFMAGLAVGNGLAARHAGSIRRPLRAYALLEAVVAVLGAGLVLAWPLLGPVLAPWFRALADSPVALNLVRAGIAFSLMMVPAAAMGATLPILIRVLGARIEGFGRVLGWLYGVNTLGAVAGAIAAEMLLVSRLGIRGSALAAAALNLGAATTALALSRFEVGAPEPGPASASRVAPRILAAACVCGAALLALEVIWFRFLALFVSSTSLAFALLLAVVLLGIAGGGFVAAALLRKRPAAHDHLRPILLLAGILTLATYAQFGRIGGLEAQRGSVVRIVALASFLTFPVSLLSGISFTLLGHRAHPEGGSEARTAGQLTLANTLGAMLGSLAGGFLLLPLLGVEAAIVALALAYALAAALVPAGPSGRLGPAALALFGLSLAFFPFGTMQRSYLGAVGRRFGGDGSRILTVREGLTETLIYMRRDNRFSPPVFRLVTNGFSMSATGLAAQRYMSLYAWWPAAIHPRIRHALLISYGCGTTARALTRVPGMERVDVVDISREILDASATIHGSEDPLHDPRLVPHVEDGRQFLLTTNREYDLITGEPPPPRVAGVVSLYTREYFALMRERLAPGGVVTYWLPVDQLMVPDAKAIVGAFCGAFPDCSLWKGAALNWMLVATRGLAAPVREESFVAPWRDPATASDLVRIGVERPEQLGALFIADGVDLSEWAGSVPPLVDDFPHRILTPVGSADVLRDVFPVYRGWMNAEKARSRFASSRFVATAWPAGMREASLACFEWQGWLDEAMLDSVSWQPPSVRGLTELDRVLTRTPLVTLPLWLLGTNVDEQRTVAGLAARGERHEEILGLGAIAARDYGAAAEMFGRSGAASANACRRAYALALAGRRSELDALRRTRRSSPDAEAEAAFWAWMEARFGYPQQAR